MIHARTLLYVCTYDPDRADLGGGGWTDRRLLHLLRREYDVRVITVTGQPSSEEDPKLSFSNVPLTVRGSRIALGRTLCHMLLHQSPYLASKFQTWGTAWRVGADRFRDHVQAFDVVVTNGWPALLLAAEADVTPDLHVAQNVESRIAAAHAPRLLRIMSEERRLAQLEENLLGRPRVVAAIGASDVAYFNSRGIKAELLSLPLHDFTSPPVERPLTLGFIGTQTWPPNAQGLATLMDDIIPQVQRVESVRVVLAGRGTEAFRNRPGVVTAGFVENESSFFKEVDLQVVPRAGVVTGVSVKLLEGTEYGVQAIASADLIEVHQGPTPWLAADGVDEVLQRYAEFRENRRESADRLRDYRSLIAAEVALKTVPRLRRLGVSD
ncbi:MAG: hypothetical protein JWL77_7044 [Chthonomonadaceae bacterium]|nr:hypothetical protein [Chthonomonadaceae bacterium]